MKRKNFILILLIEVAIAFLIVLFTLSLSENWDGQIKIIIALVFGVLLSLRIIYFEHKHNPKN